jgi:hypothetical protein
MTETTGKKPTKILETTIDTEKQEGVDKALSSQVFSKTDPAPPSTETPVTSVKKETYSGDTDSVASASTINGDAENVLNASRDTIAVAISPDTAAKEKLAEAKKPTDQPTEKERSVTNDTVAVVVPKTKPAATNIDSTAKASSLPQTVATTTNSTVTKPSISAKAPVRKSLQVVIPSTKTPIAPTPAVKSTSLTQKKPTNQPPVTPPTKRTFSPITGDTPDSKRAKSTPALLTPIATTTAPRIPPATPSPRPVSIEHKVAEQRKRLEAVRQKRLEMVQRQEELDRKMEPYRKRMAEELERLEREMMEEEAAAAEDEEYLKRSEDMLAEFEERRWA